MWLRVESIEKANTLPAVEDESVGMETTHGGIFQAFASCPSGKAVVAAIRATCHRRMQTNVYLEKIGSLKAELGTMDSQDKLTNESTTKLLDIATKYMALSTQLGKHPGNEKMLLTLSAMCTRVVDRAVAWHMDTVLKPHITAVPALLE